MSRQSKGGARDHVVSRRGVLGAAVSAVMVTPLLASGTAGADDSLGVSSRDGLPDVRALLYPLREGATLGAWVVVKMHEGLQGGALVVELEDQRGARFQVDICRRDDAPDAPVPPARTARCDLVLANGGQGGRMTDESQGLAAMALADVIRTNEHGIDLGALSTLRHRLRSRRRQVVRHV